MAIQSWIQSRSKFRGKIQSWPRLSPTLKTLTALTTLSSLNTLNGNPLA